MKQEKFERVPSRHRYLGDYHVLKPLEYTLSVRFDDPKTNAETAVTRVYNDRQTVLEVLKHTLRTVSASLVRLSVNTALFDVSQLEQSDAERLGLVDTLSATTDKASLEPSVFESLPLMCGQVANLRFGIRQKLGITLNHQTDRFVRNCIARNVRSLEVAHYDSCNAPSSDYCNVSEESLLEFCFGRHLSFTYEKKPVVSLWLDWIKLSEQFLNRFVEASEACDSDHSVHLYLRGQHAHDQGLSKCHKAPPLASTPKDYRSGTFTFYGRKHAVRVGYNPELHYLLVERKALGSSGQFFAESRGFRYVGNGQWKLSGLWWVNMY